MVNFCRKPALGSLFGLSALALAATAPAQSVTLKLNLPVGKTYSYVTTTKSQSSGGPMNVSSDQRMEMSLAVLSKSAQGTRIRTKITDVKITVPPNTPGANMIKAQEQQLKNTSFEATYDSRGRSSGFSGSSANSAANKVMQGMGSMRFGFMGVEFPAGPVSPGSKWSSNIDFKKLVGEMGMGMVKPGKNSNMPVAFKLVKVANAGGKKVAQIAYSMIGKIDMSVSNPQSGQSMPMNLTFNVTGNVTVDTATGLPLTNTSSGSTSTAVMGMNITQKVSTSIKLK